MTLVRRIRTLVGLAIAFWIATLCLFVCSETEEVLVTQFGRIVRVVGRSPGQAGLKFKAPWQGLVRVDRRSRLTDLPTTEAATADKKNLEVGLALAWRVTDAERFVAASANAAEVESRLAERAVSAVVETMARHPMSDLVSTSPDRAGPDGFADEVAKALNATAAESFGVQVARVMVRRIAYPTEIRPAVFDQIRAERAQVASRIRAEAQAKAVATSAKSRRDRETTIAKARAEAESIVATADAEALGILNEAHSQDPKLYELMRSLETYKSLGDSKTTMILSSGSPLWKLLWQGPSVDFAGDSPPVPNVGPAPEPIGASELTPRPRPEALEEPK